MSEADLTDLKADECRRAADGTEALKKVPNVTNICSECLAQPAQPLVTIHTRLGLDSSLEPVEIWLIMIHHAHGLWNSGKSLTLSVTQALQRKR